MTTLRRTAAPAGGAIAALAGAAAPTIERVLTPRQELILRKVVLAYQATVQPVASRTLAADPELQAGPSTVRHELAMLEEHGLLAHPHTSAGRVPTDMGFRYFVDRLLPAKRERASLELELTRREVDEAMRATTETLSQITNLLAIVSAPPLDTATIRHIEVLLLQPQIVMVVIITSTGGVSKRMLTFPHRRRQRPRRLGGGVPQRAARRHRPRRPQAARAPRRPDAVAQRARASSTALMPAFTDLAATAEDTLYVDGAARLLHEHRFHDLSQINALMQMLEGRVDAAGDAAHRARRPQRRRRAHRRRERGARACARWRWSPPATACRCARWARSR